MKAQAIFSYSLIWRQSEGLGAPPLNMVPFCFNNENLLNQLVNKVLRYIVLFTSLS